MIGDLTLAKTKPGRHGVWTLEYFLAAARLREARERRQGQKEAEAGEQLHADFRRRGLVLVGVTLRTMVRSVPGRREEGSIESKVG